MNVSVKGTPLPPDVRAVIVKALAQALAADWRRRQTEPERNLKTRGARRKEVVDALPNEVLSPRRTSAVCGGISLTTIWRLRQRGEFPEPVKLSPGRVGWRRVDIETWLRERHANAGKKA